MHTEKVWNLRFLLSRFAIIIIHIITFLSSMLFSRKFYFSCLTFSSGFKRCHIYFHIFQGILMPPFFYYSSLFHLLFCGVSKRWSLYLFFFLTTSIQFYDPVVSKSLLFQMKIIIFNCSGQEYKVVISLFVFSISICNRW